MSRINIARLRKLEAKISHFSDLSHLNDEQLIARACDYDPHRLAPLIEAYRAGSLDAIYQDTIAMLDSPADDQQPSGN